MDYGQILFGAAISFFIAFINTIVIYYVNRGFRAQEKKATEAERNIQLLRVDLESHSGAMAETLLNGNRETYNKAKGRIKQELLEELKFVHK